MSMKTPATEVWKLELSGVVAWRETLGDIWVIDVVGCSLNTDTGQGVARKRIRPISPALRSLLETCASRLSAWRGEIQIARRGAKSSD